MDDEISLGKVNVLLSNPAESTLQLFWYSLGFAMMWLLTQIIIPQIPFLFVSSDFCRLAYFSAWVALLTSRDHLLMLQGITLAHKGLVPSGLSLKFIMSKNLIIFTIQGTHKG